VEHRRTARVLETVAAQTDGSLPERLCDGASLLLSASGWPISVEDLALDLFVAPQAGHPADELDQLFPDGTANSAEAHQAVGMVSGQRSIAIGAALALLRARACSDGRSLSEIARDVVARQLRFDHDE